jgi:hypothetical protein
MKVRVDSLLIAALAALGFVWAVNAREGGADERHPVVVGSERVPALELERRAPSLRRAAADRAIERLWLRGEAAARGVRLSSAALPGMRGQVADAIAGDAEGSRFAARFDAFHARWRAATTCLPAYHDPFSDRCGDRAPAPEGACRWMGEASLCRVVGARRRSWLVFHAVGGSRRVPRSLLRRARFSRGGYSIRLRRRTDAVAVAHALYRRARAARERARAARERDARRIRAARERDARLARAARERDARLARAAAERRRRLAEPALSGLTLAAARPLCARFARQADPYEFGMQDPAGQADGLLAARTAAVSRLPGAARDEIDRRKLQPLLRAVRAGNGFLARMRRAAVAGDAEGAEASLRRYDARLRREQRLARGLGLGDCLGLRTRRGP